MMEYIDNIEGYLFWFGLGAVLLGCEALFGKRFVFMAASFAAVIVGGLSYVWDYVPFEIQLLFFVVLSSIMIWVIRSYLKSHVGGLQAREKYMGRELILMAPIVNGSASISLDGKAWRLVGRDMPSGSRVRVVAMGKGELTVEPLNRQP